MEMWELEVLEHLVKEIGHELETIKARKKTLKRLIEQKGYSLKTIKGYTYLYVWKTVEHAKAKWRSLGNIDKLGRHAIYELRKNKADILLKEWSELTQKEKELIGKVKKALEALQASN